MTKLTLREARLTLGLSQKDLAEISRISTAVIHRVENDNAPFAVREETAALLASSLACSVDEIYWPHGLSRLGRMPLTGKEITSYHQAQPPCNGCNLTLPVSGQCDNCL